MMIGFSIMMWFVSIILFIVSISLLKGNYLLMHGKVFDNAKDKEGFAKATGKPVLFMAFGIAVSGIVAVVTNNIVISVIIVLCVAVIMGIWLVKIQKRFA